MKHEVRIVLPLARRCRLIDSIESSSGVASLPALFISHEPWQP